MEQLGKNIRDLRRKHALTLKQLSKQTHLSVSFLSEIERGLAQPSMASLRKIRDAIGLSLFRFQDFEINKKTNNQIPSFVPQHAGSNNYTKTAELIKSSQRKRLAYPGQPGYYELLTPDLNRQLEVLYFKMEPGWDTGPEKLIDPPGEKCMVIFSGNVTFKVEDQVFELEAGDSLSYPADAGTSWSIHGEDSFEGILIITPPGF